MTVQPAAGVAPEARRKVQGHFAARPNARASGREQGTVPLLVGRRVELRRRLHALVQDVDEFWRDSLESRDFGLVTSSVEASHAMHRALVALEVDDRAVIGERIGGTKP